MAQNIILKKSSVLGRIPDSSDLSYGELALNYTDGKLYFKKNDNNVAHFLSDSAGNYLDSSEILNLVSGQVDSAYVNARTTAPTAAQVSAVLDAISNSIIPDTDVAFDLGDSTKRFKDLYLSDSSIIFGQTATLTAAKINLIPTVSLDSAIIKNMFSASGDLAYDSATGQFSITVSASTDSATVNTLIDAKTQVLDIGDIVGADGTSGQVLKSLGNGNSTWIDQATLVRPHLVAGTNITYDSATGVITADLSGAGGIDSAGVTGIIDSAYIQARQADIFRDSAFVTGIVDAAYIQARDRIRDSNFVQDIVDSAYVQLRQAAPTAAQVRPFMVAGSNITYDSATGVISSTASGTLDSAAVVGIVDSAYVNSRVTASTDSATVNTLIDAKTQVLDIGDIVGADGTSGQLLKSLGNGNSTWVNTSTFVTLDSSTLTSGFAGNIIPATDSTYDLGDSNRRWRDLYLSGNTIYLGETATLTAAKVNLIPTSATTVGDSSSVTGLIDSAYVQARQSLRDSAFVTGIVSGTYIQANQTDYLDSSLTTQLINAAYIQANQTSYNTSDFADSAFVTTQINNLIDGAPGALNTLNELAAALNDDSDAYNTLLASINANTSAIAGKLDSALTISLIDSAYVAARVTASSGTDSAVVNTLIDAKTQVLDIGDIVGADGTSGQILKSLGNGNSTWINQATLVRPHLVAGSNITYDSATGVIASTASGGIDSALTTQLIDSAYVQARQTLYSTADFADSAFVTTQINNLIDGAPGALNTLNELAAALNDDSDAYNTLLALINANTSAVNGKLDSALTTQLINAAYIQANQTLYSTADFADSAFVTTQVATRLDSALTISLIDSAYVAARVTVSSSTDSAAVNTLIDAKTQVLDIGDIVGADGNSGQILRSLGNGNSEWIGLDSYNGSIIPSQDSVYDLGSPTRKWKDLYLSESTIYFGDSVTLSAQQVQFIPTSVATVVDSASVRALFTSAGDLNYNASTGIFSLTVSSVVDSAYISARVSDLGATSSNFSPTTNNSQDLGDSTSRWKDLYLSDNSIIFGETATLTAAKINLIPTVQLDSAIIKTTITDSAYVQGIVSSSYIQANQTLYSTADFADSAFVNSSIQSIDIDDFTNVSGTNGYYLKSLGNREATWATIPASGLDSSAAISLIDSAYVTGIVNGTYIQSNQTNFLDSSLTTQLINAAYIQSNQTLYSTADFADSAFVTTQINNLIDGAPGALNTLNELAAALNDDSDAYNTLLASINANTTLIAGKLDSALTTQLIDSAYVSSRVTNYADSAVVNTLIDAKTQVLDIGDIVGAEGTSGQVLKSLGNGNSTWDSSGILSLAGLVGDSTPQLGGNLDVNGNDIVSVSNGNIELDPNGSGQVVFKGNATKGAGQFVLNCENNSHGITIKGPPHSAAASYTLTLPDNDGNSDQLLQTNGSGSLSWTSIDSAYVQLRQAAPTAAQVRPFLVAGSNITYDSATGVIASTASGGSQNLFSTIAVAGQSNVEADGTTDTLTLVAGSNVTITTDAGTDTITIASSGGGGGLDSALTLSLVRQETETLDIDDFTNNDGQDNYYLKSVGNREAEWTDLDVEIRQKAFASALIFS